MPVEADGKQEIGIEGTCILCGEEQLVSGLSKALEKCGVACAALEVGATNGEDAGILLRELERHGPTVSDVVYIAPATIEDVSSLSADGLMELEARTLKLCLRITQALLRMKLKKTPRLWIVTRGAQGSGVSNVPQSALWGFGRSVAAEHPELRVRRIDLDPVREADAERSSAMYARLPARRMSWRSVADKFMRRGCGPFRRKKSAKKWRAIAELNLRLELTTAGTIDGIETIAAARQSPNADEVEIRVHAAGMNFRDVLNVLGMYKGKSGPLGGECAGTVVRVGSAVKSLKPGDEVVALGQGCFAQYVTTRAGSVWRKPMNLSFEAAVTIPIAFLTAHYALHTLAAIRRGSGC